MAIRYTGDAANEPALVLTDDTGLIKSTNAYMGKLSTLLAWHRAGGSALRRCRSGDVVGGVP